MELKDCKPGKVVALASGSKAMTIKELVKYGELKEKNIKEMVVCIWFDLDSGNFREFAFPPEVLTDK